MTTEQLFTLPDLGEGLAEATVLRWLVAVGDRVAIDQTVVEVETAKAVVEVPSPFAGRVATLHAGEGDTLEVGRPLITVDGGTAPVTPAEAYREEEKAGSGSVLIGYGTSGTAHPGRRRRPRARGPVDGRTPAAPAPAARADRPAPRVLSPIVRALARDHGVDLGTVEASGPGGLIVRADVQKRIDEMGAATGSGPATATSSDHHRPAPTAQAGAFAGGERRTRLSGLRKTVAETLSRSRSEIPEATVWVDVDATALWDLRESVRTAADPGPGLMAYVARFVVAALREHPVLNSRIDTERDEIVELEAVNLGIAVQSDRGLVVPAVMGAQDLTTAGLDREIRAVTARAREGRATREELTSGTFTLNNYGGFRVDGSAAIIHHPQVAILGLGRILDRAWVVDGSIAVRKITQMSFVFDHRVCDGGTAAGFMRSVADAIENPASAIARL